MSPRQSAQHLARWLWVLPGPCSYCCLLLGLLQGKRSITLLRWTAGRLLTPQAWRCTASPVGRFVCCFPCGQVGVLLPLWAGWRAAQHVANRACVRVQGTAWVRHGSRPLRRSQVEAHHPGGLREVVSPEGAVCMVGPGGQASAANVDDLSEEIRWLPPPELEGMESGLGAAA